MPKAFSYGKGENSLIHYIESLAYHNCQAKRDRKLRELRFFLETQLWTGNVNVLVLGPGAGLELSLLVDLFMADYLGDKLMICCVDLELGVLRYLQGLLHDVELDNQLVVTFVCGDCVNLPIAGRTFDIVISSSLQHEVYSYGGGQHALETYISHCYRVMKNGSILFLRDFASPPEALYFLELDDSAYQFWEQYQLHFRVQLGEKVEYSIRNQMLAMSSREAMEFLTHFAVKTLYDPNYDEIHTWKEINERYLVVDRDWYLHQASSLGLSLEFNSQDRELEQEEVIQAHVRIFQQTRLGIGLIHPFCARDNFIFCKCQ